MDSILIFHPSMRKKYQKKYCKKRIGFNCRMMEKKKKTKDTIPLKRIVIVCQNVEGQVSKNFTNIKKLMSVFLER